MAIVFKTSICPIKYGLSALAASIALVGALLYPANSVRAKVEVVGLSNKSSPNFELRGILNGIPDNSSPNFKLRGTLNGISENVKIPTTHLLEPPVKSLSVFSKLSLKHRLNFSSLTIGNEYRPWGWSLGSLLGQELNHQQAKRRNQKSSRDTATSLNNKIHIVPMPAYSGPFAMQGFKAIAVPGLANSDRWKALLQERADRYFSTNCPKSKWICRSAMLSKLIELRNSVQSFSHDEAIRIVNRGVNRIVRYRTDYARRGVVDYWDKFSDVIRLRSGDCEDIAMVKYWILISLGVPKSNLGLMIVRVPKQRVDHAVLAVKTRIGVRYLDNRFSQIVTPGSSSGYYPIAAMSGYKTWIYGRRVARAVR